MKPSLKQVCSLSLPVIFLIVYLLFPTNNSSLDAFGYASYIKEGKRLFLSHHLFYNALGFLWVKLLDIFSSFDALDSLKVMNAILASASLLVLGRIFVILEYSWKKASVWICFVGSSWGVMRFATENETYIAPILFSMLASLYFIKYLKSKKGFSIILSGFFAAFACLVHQIHFFWWLALLLALLKEKRIKSLLLYATPALIVPLSYIIVLVYYYQIPFGFESLTQFILRDFESGSATVSIGTKSIIFVGISFVRTFFQAHGYFVNLLRIHPWLYVAIGIALTFLGFAISQIKRISFNRLTILQTFAVAHILAFCLHLLFAFLSHGNAEFMVMLPFLMAISMSLLINHEVRVVGLVAASLFIWNLFFGLIPLKYHNIDGNSMVVKRIIQNKNTKDKSLYILFNKPAIENQVRYYTDTRDITIYSGSQKTDTVNLQQAISNAINSGKTVLTDCMYRPKTISRETLTVKFDEDIFKSFKINKDDSISTLTGTYYMVEIIK